MSFSPLKSDTEHIDSPGNSTSSPVHSESSVVIFHDHSDVLPKHGTQINRIDNNELSTSIMSTATLWQMNDEEYMSWLVS